MGLKAMQRLASSVLIGAIFTVLVLVAVPAPAAAHDPGCVVSAHAGPAKVHVQCDPNDRDDDSSGCLLSVNAGPAHKSVLC